MITTPKFNSFKEFYPFYLSEHRKQLNKLLHFIGSLGVLGIITYSLINANSRILYFAPLCGYGFAWIGHFFIENNKPATFKYPVYSFIGDWVMFKDILLGKIKL
jgi:hypothetical protein|tara:strand:+ start:1169 stop:1480 length:312 start_codon:yes stop_codon:yes gene_type:complete